MDSKCTVSVYMTETDVQFHFEFEDNVEKALFFGRLAEAVRDSNWELRLNKLIYGFPLQTKETLP